MIRVLFKKLQSSDLIKEIAKERIQSIVEKFPDFEKSRVTLTVSMENSPQQPGPDVFTAKFISQGGRYDGIVLKKSDSNLYAALSSLVHHLLERLNRFGDKLRVKRTHRARREKKIFHRSDDFFLPPIGA